MGTRALYTFKDKSGEYHVYKHFDGYPTGALGFIEAAKKFAWELPRFEADEFAASFIAANKDSGGGIHLTVGKTWEEAAPADIEYHYVITEKECQLHVACYSTNCWDKPTQKLLKHGFLPAMQRWAKKDEDA